MNTLKPSDRAKELETLAVLSLFFMVVSAVTHRQSFIYIAIMTLVIALFFKAATRAISSGWLRFAEVIGTFNSKVILSLVFLIFLTPIAFLYRCFNNNPLMLKSEKRIDTFYTERNHVYTKADLEKMW